MLSKRNRAVLVAAGIASAMTTAADATWSILIVDTRTGEIALGSATCVQGIDLRVETPVLLVGIGGATAQSAVDSTGLNKTLIRDRLLEGVSLAAILAELDATDSGHQVRQYGMIDVGGGTLTFSGSGDSDWAGGVTGSIAVPGGEIVYAIQGNILVGPEPVLAAEAAILTTNGDLAAKLMAGMIAARQWGGDGRCSCTTGGPTSCDVPPPEPFKSADVGYMLIARPGDDDGSMGVYNLAGRASGLIAMHLDDDGLLDVVAAGSAGNRVDTFINAGALGDGVPHLRHNEQVPAGVGTIREIASGDITGDGHEDIVIVSSSPSAVTLLPRRVELGLATTGFEAPQITLIDGLLLDVAVGDLDGVNGLDVVAVGGTTGSIFVMLSTPGGGLGAPLEIAVGTHADAVAIGDVTGDGNADIVVTRLLEASVRVLEGDGAGGLVLQAPMDTGVQPTQVRLGDLNGDGRLEIVTANNDGRSLTVLMDTGAGWTRTDYAVARDCLSLDIADINNDGHLDVAGMITAGKHLQVFMGDGTGALAEPIGYPIQRQPSRILLADLTGDDMPDLISAAAQAKDMVLIGNQGDGRFPEFEGMGSGNYYLALNVAKARSADPDPVDQLAEKFDLWRNEQLGQTDAFQSKVTGPGSMVSSTDVAPPSSAAFSGQLSDWTGDAVVEGGLVVSVRTAFGSPQLVEVTGITQPVGGAFSFTVEGLVGQRGATELIVEVTGPSGSVELMPRVSLRVLDATADFNGDGTFDFFDVMAFLTAFGAGDLSADLNGDGVLDFFDVQLFVSLMLGS